MKCVKNPMTGEVRRVADDEAKRLAYFGWEYISKTEWKGENARRKGAAHTAPINSPLRRRV